MKKRRIRSVLRGVGMAGLAAGVTIMMAGCQSGSCGHGSCGGKKMDKAKSSCGQGSCGANKAKSKMESTSK